MSSLLFPFININRSKKDRLHQFHVIRFLNLDKINNYAAFRMDLLFLFAIAPASITIQLSKALKIAFFIPHFVKFSNPRCSLNIEKHRSTAVRGYKAFANYSYNDGVWETFLGHLPYAA